MHINEVIFGKLKTPLEVNGNLKVASLYVEQAVTVERIIKFVSPNVSVYWLVDQLHFNTFCLLSTVKTNQNKRNGWQKYLTKKLASFVRQPVSLSHAINGVRGNKIAIVGSRAAIFKDLHQFMDQIVNSKCSSRPCKTKTKP